MNKFYYFLFTVLFSLLIFSCGNGVSDNNNFKYQAVSNGTSQKSSTKILRCSAFSNCLNFRSIEAPAYTSDELDFYIFGNNKSTGSDAAFSTGSGFTKCLKLNMQKKNDSGTKGEFQIQVENGSYIFYVAAVEKGAGSFDYQNYKNSAVLLGNATVDTRNQNSFEVYLTPLQRGSSKGSVAFALYTSGWNLEDYSGYYSKVELYKRDLLNTRVAGKTYIIPYYADTPSFSDFTSDYILECNNITADTYNLVVTFTNDVKSYIYSDTVSVNANRNYQIVVPVSNVITSAINAPSDFIVGYRDSELASNQCFYLNAEWTDNSDNESKFTLEMMDISNPSNTNNYTEYVKCILGLPFETPGLTKDISWAQLVNDCGCPQPRIIDNEYLLESGYTIDGTLGTNSNYVIFSVLMDVKYLIRLCAENDNDKSPYVYPNIYSGNFSSGLADVYSWASDARAINRFAIYYKMTNGKFYDDSDAANLIYTDVTDSVAAMPAVKNVVYSACSDAGQKIFVPENLEYESGKTASLMQIYQGTVYPWLGWKTDSLDGSFICNSGDADVYYKDFKSISLFSYFRDGDDTIFGSDKIKFYTSSNNSVDTSTVMLFHGNSKSLSVDMDNILELDDASIEFSRSTLGSSYLYFLCRTSEENFVKTNLTFGRQGYTYENFGEGKTFATAWSGGSVYTYSYWVLPVSSLESGLYYINLDAYENIKEDPYSTSLEVIIRD